jgi:hypothetical protein
MAGSVSSHNVSVAAGILLFEAVRQRAPLVAPAGLKPLPAGQAPVPADQLPLP